MKPLHTSSPGRGRVFFAVLSSACLAFLPLYAEDVTVMKGSSTRISVAEGVKKITVGSPNIIDARPAEDGRSILVSGLAEGSSELRVERLQGAELITKVVVSTDLRGMLEQIKELLSDVDGLEFKTVGNRVVLRGTVMTKPDSDKVGKVADAYSGVVLNLSTFDSGAMTGFIKKKIEEDIGIETVTVAIIGDTVILEGIVYSEADASRAVEMAKLRMPNVRNLLSIQKLIIETDVQFVQVTGDKSTDFGRNILKTFGVDGTVAAQGANTGKPTLNWGVNASASARINALIGQGNGKIVAQNNISTTSGTEGDTMVGGEFIIPVSGNVGGSVEKVQFGLILKVKPILQGRDSIVSAVTFEMSVPTGRAQAGTITLEKSKTSTTVMCKAGESVILSGLAQALGTSSKEKTPLLGDIPVLNLLFAEKTSRKEKKEVVVVLTSRLIKAEIDTGPAFSEERKKLLENIDIKK